MRRARFPVVVAALGGLSTLLGLALAQPASATDARSLRVLFVGNSYSNHNGLTETVEALAHADGDGPAVETELVFLPGASLRRHWRTRKAARYLRGGGYTHVVLQGHSLDTFERPDALARYVARFDQAAERSGARTLLYATWARHRDNVLYLRGEVGDDPEQMQDHIDAVYGRIAGEVGARVAPVGRAWRRALDQSPDLALHRPDGSHPTRRGSYLAACVLYGSLTGRSPQGLEHYGGLDPALARRLQAVAAATLRAP